MELNEGCGEDMVKASIVVEVELRACGGMGLRRHGEVPVAWKSTPEMRNPR